MIKIFCVMILVLATLSYSQTFQMEINTIPVTKEERQLLYPWNGGLNSLSPVMPDLDNDGDYDLLFTGGDNGRLHYYKNTSEGLTPVFTLEDNQLNEVYFGNRNSRMTMDDIDFDGDLDLIIGENYGKLDYYRNDGNSTQPEFVFVTDLFDSIDVGYQAAPTFADLNGDGLKDLLIGSYESGIQYFIRNDSTSLRFTASDTLRDQSGAIINPDLDNHMIVPSFADIDDDGDLDLFVDYTDDVLIYYNNTGSESVPQFTLADASYIIPPDGMSYLTPVFVDIDLDQDLDLFFGSNHGYVTFYRNEGTASEADFILETNQIPLDYLDFGFYSSPFLLDIDSDEDKDLFVSNSSHELHYFENTGTVLQPEFTWITDHFEDIDDPARTQAWGDLDNDGDFDLLFCGFSGNFYHYMNIGDANSVDFDARGLLLDSLGNQMLGDRPDLVDLDGDGDLDIATNIHYNTYDAILIYHNVGTPDSMIFVAGDTLRDESEEIISFFDGFFRFIDFDDDGMLDLIIGHGGERIARYETINSLGIHPYRLLDSYFADVWIDNDRILPYLTDIDGDSQIDLFFGRFRGGLFYYHNITASNISSNSENTITNYFLEQNYPNPFNPTTVIGYRLSAVSDVELSIYNLLGQKLVTLVSEKKNAGYHQVVWDASAYSSGVYVYTLKTSNGLMLTRKMLLLK